MNIVKDYVENMFSSLPKTSENQKLKAEVLSKMEIRYNGLLKKGMSQNEAYGTVISEFGNIDDILAGSVNTWAQKGKGFCTEDEAEDFLKKKKKSSFLSSLGVMLLMLGISSYMFAEEMINRFIFSQEVKDFIEFIPLMIILALGVLMLFLSNIVGEKYSDIKHLSAERSVIDKIQERYNSFKKKYNFSFIISVMALVLSPIVYFLGEVVFGKESNMPSAWCITYLSVFIFILVYVEGIKDSYNVFLEKKKPSGVKQKGRTARFAASVIFILAVTVYLIWSFLFKAWGISWIVFVVSGLIYLLALRIIAFIYEKEE